MSTVTNMPSITQFPAEGWRRHLADLIDLRSPILSLNEPATRFDNRKTWAQALLALALLTTSLFVRFAKIIIPAKQAAFVHLACAGLGSLLSFNALRSFNKTLTPEFAKYTTLIDYVTIPIIAHLHAICFEQRAAEEELFNFFIDHYPEEIRTILSDNTKNNDSTSLYDAIKEACLNHFTNVDQSEVDQLNEDNRKKHDLNTQLLNRYNNLQRKFSSEPFQMKTVPLDPSELDEKMKSVLSNTNSFLVKALRLLNKVIVLANHGYDKPENEENPRRFLNVQISNGSLLVKSWCNPVLQWVQP